MVSRRYSSKNGSEEMDSRASFNDNGSQQETLQHPTMKGRRKEDKQLSRLGSAASKVSSDGNVLLKELSLMDHGINHDLVIPNLVQTQTSPEDLK